MKALVTGGLGFIGSNFILQLLEKNQEIQITNVDAKFYGSNFQNLINVENNQNYQFVEGNINDVKLMEKLIEKNDIIINFAETGLPNESLVLISQSKIFSA